MRLWFLLAFTMTSACVPFCGLEIEEGGPCTVGFRPACPLSATCFDNNGTAVCGNCDSDDDCEFGCRDFVCLGCREDSDCAPGALCDPDGQCLTAVCDVDFSCDATAGEVCLDEACEVLPCGERSDAACVDEGFLCGSSGSCQLPDDVTGGCNLGPQRSFGGPLLISASLTRAADEDARCPQSTAWRLGTTAALATQATPQIFVDDRVPQEVVRFTSERDAVSFDVPVEEGEAVVCIALPVAPFQAQINVFDDADRPSNGICLDVIE